MFLGLISEASHLLSHEKISVSGMLIAVHQTVNVRLLQWKDTWLAHGCGGIRSLRKHRSPMFFHEPYWERNL